MQLLFPVREHAVALWRAELCLASQLVSCLLVFDLTDLTFQGREFPQSTTLLYLGAASKNGNVVRRNTHDKALMAVAERAVINVNLTPPNTCWSVNLCYSYFTF